MVLGVLGQGDRAAQAALVGERAPDQRPDRLVVERLQGQQHAPRQQGEMIEKYGFSVVAASSVTVPSSTADSSESCWVLENRCTSSMNSTVASPPVRRTRRASSITARTSLTPALSADSAANRRSLAPGDQVRDRGLAGAGRTPQDHRGRAVPAADQPAQRRARAEQVLLADQLVDRARAHPDRERGVRRGRRETRPARRYQS